MNYNKIFVDNLFQFVDAIQNVFPDNVDVRTAKNALELLKKANPTLLPKFWYEHIYAKYKNQIDNNDINFFIQKDYTDDLVNAKNSSKILESINKLRQPVAEMSEKDQQTTMKHIKQLSQLSQLIHENNF